jgi:hypothetical protein
METLVKENNVLNHRSVNELVKGVNTAVQKINEKIAIENWRLNNFNINENILSLMITNLSLNQRKKLKNNINSCVNKQTLRTINRFFHFLQREVYKDFKSPAPSVKISLKEEKIQEARKKYIAARKIAIDAYDVYKAEKGDFYKK